MKKDNKKPLINDDIADVYKKQTGDSMRIKPLSFAVQWALKRKDLFFWDEKEDLFYLKEDLNMTIKNKNMR